MNKKKLLLTIIATSLFGCSANSSVSNISSDSIDPKDLIEDTKDDRVEYVEKVFTDDETSELITSYDKAFTAYYAALESNYDSSVIQENKLSSLLNVNSNVGYAFVDLNGDDNYELFFADMNDLNDAKIYDMYVLFGETVIHLISSSENDYYSTSSINQEIKSISRTIDDGSGVFEQIEYEYTGSELIVSSAIKYDNSQDGPWFQGYELDGAMQYDSFIDVGDVTGENTYKLLLANIERLNYTKLELPTVEEETE